LDERIAEVLPGSGSLQDRTRIFNFDHSLAHSQVIEERNGTGYLSAYHTVMPFANAQGARRLSELRGTPQSNASDLPANPVWHRYVSDHQSTTRALVDATGSITDTFGYLPYGEVNQRTGNTQTAFQYTGEPLAAGGLTYLRARFVDPRQGRFLGMDRFMGRNCHPATLHKYAYQNPVNSVDPTGKVTLMQAAIVSSFALTGGAFLYSHISHNYLVGRDVSIDIDGLIDAVRDKELPENMKAHDFGNNVYARVQEIFAGTGVRIHRERCGAWTRCANFLDMDLGNTFGFAPFRTAYVFIGGITSSQHWMEASTIINVTAQITAHEVGHTFGLSHEAQEPVYIMSDGFVDFDFKAEFSRASREKLARVLSRAK
jgi:RHS repeat-associated protein